jgi:hypothetical protein
VYIPKVFEISPDDSIRIDVVHDKLGNLSEDNIDTNDILIPPYGSDILADSFQLFKAKENLKEYFISKKDGDKIKIMVHDNRVCIEKRK